MFGCSTSWQSSQPSRVWGIQTQDSQVSIPRVARALWDRLLVTRRLHRSLHVTQWKFIYIHHHKHPGLDHLARSVSRVTVVLSIVSLVSQFFSFLVGCKGTILKGFGFVAFFVD